ncbi:MAG: flagellar export chaperone FlgN [Bacteroidota bacterium]
METPHGHAGPGTAHLAETLLQTLDAEHAVLQTLHATFDVQMQALQRQAPAQLEEATVTANEQVSEMNRLRKKRERQMRLLGRVLTPSTEGATLQDLARALADTHEPLSTQLQTARTQLRAQAAATQQRCEEVEFTLRYAAQLGHELLEAIRGLDVPPPPRVYTAHGHSVQTQSGTSFVDRVG